jgi:hypothetical protein
MSPSRRESLIYIYLAVWLVVFFAGQDTITNNLDLRPERTSRISFRSHYVDIPKPDL